MALLLEQFDDALSSSCASEQHPRLSSRSLVATATDCPVQVATEHTEVPICARSAVVPTVIRARHYVLLPRTQIGSSARSIDERDQLSNRNSPSVRLTETRGAA
jgi:hypothetical protein